MKWPILASLNDRVQPSSIHTCGCVARGERRGDLQFKGHKYIAIHILILFLNLTATTRGCYVTRAEEEERNQQLLLCAWCWGGEAAATISPITAPLTNSLYVAQCHSHRRYTLHSTPPAYQQHLQCTQSAVSGTFEPLESTTTGRWRRSNIFSILRYSPHNWREWKLLTKWNFRGPWQHIPSSVKLCIEQ